MSIKPNLFLSMIVGDFEDPTTVKRSIESVQPYVDAVYVTVTYKEKLPTENSKLIKELRKKGVNLTFFKWEYDFSVARQFALDQVPKGEHNYVYWQDVDDILQGAENLPNILAYMDAERLSAVYFTYWYQVDLDKKTKRIKEILVKHKRERIIRHDDTWKWIGPLHETLIEQKQENLVKQYREECVVVHLTNHDRLMKNIDRNIEILENTVRKQQGKDPRPVLYLAKAYFDKCKSLEDGERKRYMDMALHLFHQYLEGYGEIGSENYIEPSGWAEERSTAWSYVAEIAILSGNPQIAVSAFQSAIDEAPQFPGYYINLAMAYLMVGDFKKAKHWLTVAVNTPEPKTTIIQFPKEDKLRALEVSLQINLHEGKFDLAEEDMRKMKDLSPDNEAIEDRLQQVITLNAFNKACQSVVYLGKYLEARNEADKISHLIRSMPQDMQNERFAAEMRHKFLPTKTWEKDEITILCGPGVEEWSPKSIETGIGGSEEAVIYLSQELKKLGWKVTVYANPGKDVGDHDGVVYLPWYELNVKDYFNALILWRNIGFVDLEPKARFIMTWLHDVPNNPDFTKDRLDQVDKIAVLSEYHKSLLRFHDDGEFKPMPENKVFLTANGLPELGTFEVERNPKRIIYMSSPDRGLVYLLKNWGLIKKEVPEVELHIFYGFHVFDVLFHDNPAQKKWKAKMLEMMKQPGITYHGRVSHKQLHEEIAKSGIWAYPTHFTEISCISAMKAQALGAIPVTTTLAALDETVKNGVKVDADITTESAQKEYVEALIDLLNHPEKQEELRQNMQTWAVNQYSWENVAKDWDKLIKVKTLAK